MKKRKNKEMTQKHMGDNIKVGTVSVMSVVTSQLA